MALTLRLEVIAGALLVLFVAFAGYGHLRYEAGKRAAEAACDAKLKVISDAKAVADKHALDAERAAQDATDEANRNAKAAFDSVAAERDAALSSLHDYEVRARRQRVSAPAGTACKPDDPAQSAARDRDHEAQIESAARGQSDAEQVIELQAYLRKLRATLH